MKANHTGTRRSLWRQTVAALRGAPRESTVDQLYHLSQRELIHLESQIGREIFGPVAKGHRREFFNTGPETWIWHEEWKDERGAQHQLTTRYDIRPDGIWKSQPGLRYESVQGEELANLRLAVQIYYERVMRELYKRNPATGKKLL